MEQLSGYDWSDQAGEVSAVVLCELLCCLGRIGRVIVYFDIGSFMGNFLPPKPDLSFTSLEKFTNKTIVIKSVVENSEAKASEAKPKVVRKNNGAPIIKDWVSDSEEEDVPQAKIEKKIVDCKKVNQKQFQNTKRIWNNANKVNHENFAKKTHPFREKKMVPRAVLMKSGLVSVNIARQVNAAYSKTTANAARQMPKIVVNAARPKAVVNVVKGNNVNDVKASTWKSIARFAEERSD
ncbi:hypothetical protein Tco_1309902 [Tanacetum coccineum]